MGPLLLLKLFSHHTTLKPSIGANAIIQALSSKSTLNVVGS